MDRKYRFILYGSISDKDKFRSEIEDIVNNIEKDFRKFIK